MQKDYTAVATTRGIDPSVTLGKPPKTRCRSSARLQFGDCLDREPKDSRIWPHIIQSDSSVCVTDRTSRRNKRSRQIAR